MYNNQSLDERIQGSVCSNDNYDYNTNEISGNRYFMKWSPQEDMKFYSKSRYGSPRMLSKSVPRKNKNLARCRINRSLNFDAGLMKSDLKFKSSPNTSLDSICCDDEKQLSRSAKIMKALNFGSFGSGGGGGIDGSPISTIGKKKVNKTLNFNFSPSPKRLSYYNNRSPCNIVHLNLSTSSPKIGKSLNFEASPAESNISSILGTSIDSIDENQNQTPSERRRSVKKSLKYHNHHTPQRKTNNHPFDFIDKSPLLRSELREKIDNIIKISTPNKQTLKKTHKKSPFIKEIFVSTPRNLYNDFDDVASSGPRTPKNRIQLIPQSMSAIKKSHKKERFPRLAEADEQLAEKLDISNEQRPLTPPIEETTKTSIFDVNSIKRSHKKDKSQKSPFNRQEDESLDGSIFSYSEIDNFCNDDDDNNKQNFIDKKQENLKISKNTILTPTKLNYDNDSNSQEISKKNDEISISPKNETRPSTPINRIDLLERVIGSSIKKSHKKLKDENKKRILAKNHENSESKIEASTSNTEQRSTTPENINSSRLLLPMFSSVKKSHKKDKRSKILSNFARRQKIFSYDREKISSTFSTSTNSIVDDDNDDDDDDDDDVDLLKNNSYDNFDNQLLLLKSSPSPQKRKLSNSSNLEDEFHPLSMNDSNSIDYKSSNEEFQIFTPIKKKKSAPNRKFTDNELNSQLNLPLNRCETPIIDQSEIIDDQFIIITPEKNESSKNKKEKMKKRKINQQKLTPKRNEKSEKKVTPKNNKSALELMGNINSVKKSHKKEKKGNRYSFKNETIENFQIETPLKEISTDLLNVSNFLTPESSLHSININNSNNNNNNNNNSTSETSFKNISQMATKFLQTYEEYDGSKPSTSYEINNDKEIVVKKKSKPLITTTPPNLLKTKKYLKSQQSESIKKSHKKKREEFKNSLIIQDHELSDDGSIFTKEDRMDDDDFSTDRAINKKKNTGTIPKKLNRTSIVINMNESHLFNEKKVRSTRRSSRLIRNMSNDGSLFGSDEEGH